jgi:hypothetical protein
MRSASVLALCLCAALVGRATPTPSILDSVLPQPRGTAGCGVDKSPGCYGPNRLRIGILTVGTTHAAMSSRVSAWINEMYTATHGYDFVVERCAASTRASYLWDDNSHYQARAGDGHRCWCAAWLTAVRLRSPGASRCSC